MLFVFILVDWLPVFEFAAVAAAVAVLAVDVVEGLVLALLLWTLWILTRSLTLWLRNL